MKEQLSPGSFLKKNVYEDTAKLKPAKTKLSEDDFTIPEFSEYELLSKYNYNVSQLKRINKHYALKVSGTKRELIFRVYNYLKYSHYATQIQKVFRGYIQRQLNKAHGPALLNRDLCVNETDFLSMERIKDISYDDFFSFTTEDGFTYGCELCSIHTLLKRHREKGPEKTLPDNPYNRQPLPITLGSQVKRLIRLAKLCNVELKLDTESPQEEEMTLAERNDSDTILIFQMMNELGNYVNHTWFVALSRPQLLVFYRELMDIWEYRAQLSDETKKNICSPTGRPFPNTNLHNVSFQSTDDIRHTALTAMRNMVSKGINDSFKALGAYYVLSSLTIVSFEAAHSLPWLYEAVQ